MTPAPTLQPHNETASAADNDNMPVLQGNADTSTFCRGSVSVTPAIELYRPSTLVYNGAAAKYAQPSTTRIPVLRRNADTRKRKADEPVSFDPSPADGPWARMPTASIIKIDYAQFEQHAHEVKKFRMDGAFTCPVCTKVFADNTPENVMTHLLRHLDDHSLYPYKCVHDGCGYTAITEREVQHHVTTEHQAVWTEDLKRRCTHAENKARLDALCGEVTVMLRRKLLLPNENILDVLQCVDFATLLALQRSGSAFYDVVHGNLPTLPRLRVFDFYLDLATGELSLDEIVEDPQDMELSIPFSVPHSAEFDYSVLQSVADAIGTDFIDSATIESRPGPMQAMEFDMRKAVEALPALKHIRVLSFECSLMHTSNAFDMETLEELVLSRLDNLQRLYVDEMGNRTDWTFLRKDWALRLRLLSVKAHGLFYEGEPGLFEIDGSGQTEILEYCTDFVHLEKGKSKKLKIIGWLISPEFLQRIVTTVSECEDWLTVVVYDAPNCIGSHAGYARVDVPPEHPGRSWSVGSVRYSSLDGSHRVFVQALDRNLTIAVTNHPFITTLGDACKLDT